MIDFILSSNNCVYAVALGIVLTLFVFEILGMMLGMSVLNLFDELSSSTIDADVDADADLGITPLLSWLSLDRLPLLIWLVLLLTTFGITGLITNLVAVNISGSALSLIVSLPVAAVVGLILTGRLGALLAKYLPKTDSSAAFESDFEGLVAHITVGTAKRHSPAEAKCVDQYNQTHYIMVEPIEDHESFTQNDKIILIKRQQNAWLAMRFEHS